METDEGNSMLEAADHTGDAPEWRERRHLARVPIDIPGKIFVPRDERELACVVTDISPQGAQIRSELGLEPETPVVLYVDGLGRFDGLSIWQEDGKSGIRFASGPLKQERTAAALSRMSGESAEPPRRHVRVPTNTASHFVRADGSLAACVILNLSTGGALIRTELRPAIGEYILIGKMAGRVVRYDSEGIGLEFVR